VSSPQRARTRRRRWVRPVVAILVLILVAFVVAERVAPRIAGHRVADALVTRFSLTQRPQVDLGGFPFLLRAASGELDHAQVALAGYTTQGLRFAAVHITVGRISYPSSALWRGGTASATAITGTARVTQADLVAFLRATGSSLDVQFSPGRVTVGDRVTVGGVTGDVTATGKLTLDGSSITFQADVVSVGSVSVSGPELAVLRDRLTFTAPLPDLVGIHVQSIDIGDGVAVAQARIDDMTFAL
jgi:LmeA-like phospholipid-binding